MTSRRLTGARGDPPELMSVDMKMFKTVRSLTFLAAIALATQVQPLAAQIRGLETRGPLEPDAAADEAIARIKSPY